MKQEVESVPESLIKYQTQIEISADDALRSRRSMPAQHEAKPSAEDILNTIIPPREWQADGKNYIQYVSHESVSREDAVRLKQLLFQRLSFRQARQRGICPVREQLFSQCFDQLIRQVTIDSPERGLLLMRVRDQLKMTMAAYQTLYQSGVVFGLQKQVKAQNGTEELQSTIDTLESRKTQLQERRIDLLNRKQAVEKRTKERQAIEQARMKEEIEFLKYQAQNLDTFLSTIRHEK